MHWSAYILQNITELPCCVILSVRRHKRMCDLGLDLHLLLYVGLASVIFAIFEDLS